MIKDIDKADYRLFGVLLFMLLGGMVMIMSSSGVVAMESTGDAMYFIKRQVIFMVLGIALAIYAYRTPMEKIRAYAPVLLAGFVLLVFAVHIPGLGIKIGGAKRWLRAGPLGSFQPYEFVKLAYVIFIASVFADEALPQGKKLTRSLIATGAVCAGLLSQPDMGGTLIVLAIYLIMYVIAGMPLANLLFLVPVIIAGVAYLIIKTPYRLQRIMTFMNPEANPYGAGFQIQQSLIAIGSGGPLGVGFAHSEQKFLYLPTPHTDFIFSIIGEELGLWGAVLVVGAFVYFMLRGSLAAIGSGDNYQKLLAAGITFMIMTQAFMNIGVTLALLPPKGTTLPFFSYGGSSLIASLAAAGILLAVSRRAGGKG